MAEAKLEEGTLLLQLPNGLDEVEDCEEPPVSGVGPRAGVKPNINDLEPILRSLLGKASVELSLSPQQERILWLNLWGYSDQEIAGLLSIALHTVQDYQCVLRRKTGCRSKAGYLRLLLESTGSVAPVAGSPL